MNVVALVGKSGTGKSYKAMKLARELHIDYLIDDGLLIHGQKKLEGSSAKREKTKVAAVKRAIFFWEQYRNEMIAKLESESPDDILIIGTSDKMVKQIAKNLKIDPIDKVVYIEDISTEEEIKIAKHHRLHFGKHVVPLPTLEVKKDFSGYFIDRLNIFSRVFGKKDKIIEKSVVRPTFSFMGQFSISNKTLVQIVGVSLSRVKGLNKYSRIKILKNTDGLIIECDIITEYGFNIHKVGREGIKSIKNDLEKMTQMNIISIDMMIKGVHVE